MGEAATAACATSVPMRFTVTIIQEPRIWPVMRAAPKIHCRENRCVIAPGSRADLKIEFNSKARNGGSKPRLTPSVCRTT